MVKLSGEQVRDYAAHLIQLTMGGEIGSRAKNEFEECDIVDIWGLFDGDFLTTVVGIGSEISSKKVWLGYFAVSPQYQNKGLGTKAIAFIEKEIQNRGYKWIYIETYENERFDAAVRLYKKTGYKKVGELAGFLDGLKVRGG